MEQILRQIVAKVAETRADFASSANLHDDLDVDSVRALEIVFEIEGAFGIPVPDDRFAEVRSFDELLVLVASLARTPEESACGVAS
jgi:acyl carrier protein